MQTFLREDLSNLAFYRDNGTSIHSVRLLANLLLLFSAPFSRRFTVRELYETPNFATNFSRYYILSSIVFFFDSVTIKKCLKKLYLCLLKVCFCLLIVGLSLSDNFVLRNNVKWILICKWLIFHHSS